MGGTTEEWKVLYIRLRIGAFKIHDKCHENKNLDCIFLYSNLQESASIILRHTQEGRM